MKIMDINTGYDVSSQTRERGGDSPVDTIELSAQVLFA